ncbi:MAG TPA: discoidin domain-containing protein [Verrucomicrobiota bacterium]|nr:discoidin domain-containing protein [Verrucomicrobiota bacterium]HNU50959.1 discoidin domain-containing protein [Verrucomicrobiota bacterium]
MRSSTRVGVATAVGVAAITLSAAQEPLRRILSLDGTWQIAEGTMATLPADFARTVPVPGLVDMAAPAFLEPGPKVAKRDAIPQKDPRRDAFWYRRTFTIEGPIPETAMLKVAKAMFGTRVVLNGQLLGDHAPCWTPGLFNARPALKNGANEVVIRIGADRDAVGRAHPDGFDFEKARYIPGIFDSVTLILAGTPRLDNVQVAPDIAGGRAKVRAYLDGSQATRVEVEIREAKSGKLAGQAAANAGAGVKELDVTVPIEGCRLWSPDDPFLYSVTVRTRGDEFTTRFGMREFGFDPASRRAVLNGKPYFLRGSNVTLYRFFEDSERGALPWDDDWVRTLHQRVKAMHWNCLRYCIGLAPERWYDIADEEGVLIQNEFPIWYGGDVPEAMTVEGLALEYAEWLRDQWNHPSVVIWDACNETRSRKTGDAFMRIRGLDLSDRPWDDGYSWPRRPGDTSEQHPYQFNSNFRVWKLATAKTDPEAYNNGGGDGKHAVINNEYGWHWVNRNGTPTTLTSGIYRDVLGENATPQERFHLQATWLAAATEFWRAHRNCAAVMHFVTLGYSRADGQTSDHWLEGKVASLEWEPEFHRYVRDAFAPVGLMINLGKDHLRPGAAARVPVLLVNDLERPWKGPVSLRLKRPGRPVQEKQASAEIASFGTAALGFDLAWPTEEGPAVLEAELRGADGQPVRSVREFEIKAQAVSLTEHGTVTASSVYQPAYRAEHAVDGDESSYWSSAFQDDAWLAVDLGAVRRIGRVTIVWETAFARAFTVEVSIDGASWKEVYRTANGQGGTTHITWDPTEARHVRLVCTQRGTGWGNAVRELEVY